MLNARLGLALVGLALCLSSATAGRVPQLSSSAIFFYDSECEYMICVLRVV